MLDTDVMLMDDPYKYLKQPLFKDITVLNQAESPFDPNGGVLYVQNAAPDGPAAFMRADGRTMTAIQQASRIIAVLAGPILMKFDTLPLLSRLQCKSSQFLCTKPCNRHAQSNFCHHHKPFER